MKENNEEFSCRTWGLNECEADVHSTCTSHRSHFPYTLDVNQHFYTHAKLNICNL